MNKGVPGFNWNNGHSGEMLNDEQAFQLEEVWHNYVEHVHQTAIDEKSMVKISILSIKRKVGKQQRFINPRETILKH